METDDEAFRRIALEMLLSKGGTGIQKAVMLNAHKRGIEMSLDEYEEMTARLSSNVRAVMESLGFNFPPDLPDHTMTFLLLALQTKDEQLLKLIMEATGITKSTEPENRSAEG